MRFKRTEVECEYKKARKSIELYPNGHYSSKTTTKNFTGYRVVDGEGNDLAPGWVVHHKNGDPDEGWVFTQTNTGWAANSKASDRTRQLSAKRLLLMLQLIPSSGEWITPKEVEALSENGFNGVVKLLFLPDEEVEMAFTFSKERGILNADG